MARSDRRIGLIDCIKRNRQTIRSEAAKEVRARRGICPIKSERASTSAPEARHGRNGGDLRDFQEKKKDFPNSLFFARNHC
jgi:hypothetical protein